MIQKPMQVCICDVLTLLIFPQNPPNDELILPLAFKRLLVHLQACKGEPLSHKKALVFQYELLQMIENYKTCCMVNDAV